MVVMVDPPPLYIYVTSTCTRTIPRYHPLYIFKEGDRVAAKWMMSVAFAFFNSIHGAVLNSLLKRGPVCSLVNAFGQTKE